MTSQGELYIETLIKEVSNAFNVVLNLKQLYSLVPFISFALLKLLIIVYL